MGRTKPIAKRRRVEDEQDEKDAIQVLLSIPQDQVEAAAAVATRESCRAWPKLEVEDEEEEGDTDTIAQGEMRTRGKGGIPDWLNGLGKSMTVPSAHLQALKSLHETIKDQASVWTSWSGSPDDPRQRAFGFLPDTLGYETSIRDRLDISTPWSQDPTNNDEERKRNHRAMVILDQVPNGAKQAIEYLCQEFSKKLGDTGKHSNLQTYLQYSNLIAAQPNLHCGRELLPTHVDHPKKDGFGVIIVTISIVGSGTILLMDHADKEKCTMEVSEGQAYMLSGMARDACSHGVVATTGHRESLNLRFGLHELEKGVDHPLILSSNVLQYWETEAILHQGTDGTKT